MKNKVFYHIVFILFASVNIYAQTDTTIYDWDSGNGHTWPGWTYGSDITGYGNTGYYYTDGYTCSYLNPAPEIFEKTDYGNSCDLEIDTTDRAPSTSTGGCLLVTEDGGTSHQCCFWIFKNCSNFGSPLNGLTSAIDSTYDRLELYVKNTGTALISTSGAANVIPNYTHHFGTYLCDGEHCPDESGDAEGPGNQHYYHQAVMNSGAWVHLQLNRHPEHLRGDSGGENPGDNPAYDDYGIHYMQSLNRGYFEQTSGQSSETTMKVDEVVFTKASSLGEANQNDETIGTLWVGYWQISDTWEMGWYDVGYPEGNSEFSTYEIRYSTSPITNSNFSSASNVTFTSNGYGGTAYTGNANYARKAETGREIAFVRFTLPDNIEQNYSRIYFALKDVSSDGGNQGTFWPYTLGDGRDALNNNVRCIDYHLSSSEQEQRQTASQKKTDISIVTEDSN